MPKIFRVMKGSQQAGPTVGTGATKLGVRVPKDISADALGQVVPGIGGMSVAPRLEDLPWMFVPERLGDLVPGASGNNNDYVWHHGDGPFEVAAVSAPLVLRPDRPDHGVVEPAVETTLDNYRADLAATGLGWRIER